MLYKIYITYNMNSICLRCKAKTPDVSATIVSKKSGKTVRKMKLSTCGKCGGKKSQFVSNSAKSGFLGSVLSSIL